MDTAVSRRDFLRTSALAGGGLAIHMHLPGCRHGGHASVIAHADTTGEFVPNAWLRITPDNRIVFILGQVEMGQGVMTGQPMLLAEELAVDPSRIEVEFAPADSAYNNPLMAVQATGGSTSTRAYFTVLREAGALAREMLRAAAAEKWDVPVAQCTAAAGHIHHAATSRSLPYGDLTQLAARQRVARPILKSPEDFEVIGQSVDRLDGRVKVDGSADFGIDVQLPGMWIGVVIRSPVVGGKVISFDAAKARSLPGVHHIVEISRGVAVLADTYWQARSAADQVSVEWDLGVMADFSTEALAQRYRELAETEGTTARDHGDCAAAIGRAAKKVGGLFEVPYLAHATMEPMNATAYVHGNLCDVWTGTQSVAQAQEVAATVSGRELEKTVVHSTFIGGGFGRRGNQDFVAEAVEISTLTGRPIKVIWSREDDQENDFYRPAITQKVEAGLDAEGRPIAWFHRVVSQSIIAQMAPGFTSVFFPRAVPQVKHWLGETMAWLIADKDPTSTEGADDLPYAIDNVRVEFVLHEPGIPVGFWRSVGHSGTAFAVESVVDELAHAAGRDPVEFRRELLRNAPRHMAVLDLVAEKSGWSQPPPEGVSRGIAIHGSFGTLVAQVAEVSVKDGQVKVHRVVCAVDCGIAVNPDIVAAQMQSGIVYGLSAALKQRITFNKGRVVETNFDDYELVRMNDSPTIEVHIVPSTESPTGVGEPGTPPVAPAVANAIFVATGKRIRSLPIGQQLET